MLQTFNNHAAFSPVTYVTYDFGGIDRYSSLYTCIYVYMRIILMGRVGIYLSIYLNLYVTYVTGLYTAWLLDVGNILAYVTSMLRMLRAYVTALKLYIYWFISSRNGFDIPVRKIPIASASSSLVTI